MTASNLWPDALPRSGNLRFKQLESVSAWFTVYAVNADTFAICEPNHYEEVISYLVLGSERAVLIDTGMGIGNIRAEVEALTELTLIVVNTHSHIDHVGDNYRFDEVWAYANQDEIAKIERGYDQAICARVMPPDSYMNLPDDFDLSEYHIPPSQVTRRLQHLEQLDLGGRILEVHHTPGHSPGSICLLDKRDGLLFTGDTVYPGALIASLKGASFTTYVDSMRYLNTLSSQVSQLCPSHNEAYAPKQLLVEILAAFEKIAANQVEFELRGSARLYRFEGFTVSLPDKNN